MNIEFYKCKLDTHQLMELSYWPATPSRPVLAFSLSLMDWMGALLLECQVAVSGVARLNKVTGRNLGLLSG